MRSAALPSADRSPFLGRNSAFRGTVGGRAAPPSRGGAERRRPGTGFPMKRTASSLLALLTTAPAFARGPEPARQGRGLLSSLWSSLLNALPSLDKGRGTFDPNGSPAPETDGRSTLDPNGSPAPESGPADATDGRAGMDP